MTKRPRLSRVILSLAIALASASIHAAECTVSTTPLNFGKFDPLAGTPAGSSGTIGISCSVSTAYTISINGGTGSVDDRRMTSGTHTLAYQLFTDVSLSYVWGDGTAGTLSVAGSADAAETTHTVYGRIPVQPLAVPGSYADVLIVSVTY
jgi:spore coat protein U-like protein